MACTSSTHPSPPKAAYLNDDVVDPTIYADNPSDEEELDVGDTHYEIAERRPYPPFAFKDMSATKHLTATRPNMMCPPLSLTFFKCLPISLLSN